jgi:hypothetical protein
MTTNDPEANAEQKRAEADEARAYNQEEGFDFCPKKDLNLPSSYDEVLARFNRLQVDRAMEALN